MENNYVTMCFASYYLVVLFENCVPRWWLISCRVTRPFLSLWRVWLARHFLGCGVLLASFSGAQPAFCHSIALYCSVCKEQKAGWAGAENNTRVTWLWEAESQANDSLSLQILMISLMMTILTKRSSIHHPNYIKSGHMLTWTVAVPVTECHCYTHALSNVSTESNLYCDWLVGAGLWLVGWGWLVIGWLRLACDWLVGAGFTKSNTI